MAAKRIRVMISSRCGDKIQLGGVERELTDLRRAVKECVEKVQPFGTQIFECWINEDSPPKEGSSDSWEHCLEQVRQCEVLLVLYNGNAGWSAGDEDIGICHAEFAEGLATGAAKVFVIELPESGPNKGKNKRFRQFYKKQSRFRVEAADGDKVLEQVPQILQEALVEMVRLGGLEARKGRFDTGDALDWSRLSLVDRQAEMKSVMTRYLEGLSGAEVVDRGVFLKVNKKPVLLCVHAIPAALTVPVARELVGRPFHRDHELKDVLGKRGSGPVHIIACHKGATESQAAQLLGHFDAVFVSTSFGIYAADEVHKIQFLLLAQCRDETSTRHAISRARKWLDASGEAEHLVRRAQGRRRIVQAIAKQN